MQHNNSVNISKFALQLHIAHTLLSAALLWFVGLLLLPLFNRLPTKADVIGADSSLFSAVKQRKGKATAGLPLKQRGQLCARLGRTDNKIKKCILFKLKSRFSYFGYILFLCGCCCDVFALWFLSVTLCKFPILCDAPQFICTTIMAFTTQTDYQVLLLSITTTQITYCLCHFPFCVPEYFSN